MLNKRVKAALSNIRKSKNSMEARLERNFLKATKNMNPEELSNFIIDMLITLDQQRQDLNRELAEYRAVHE